MTEFFELDDAGYDKMAIEIVYRKLFPLIMKDFLTRSDASEMMRADNLKVLVNAGIPVQVAVPAGTGTTQGPGQGKVIATYKGETEKPKTIQKEKRYTTERKTGQVTLEESLGKLPT